MRRTIKTFLILVAAIVLLSVLVWLDEFLRSQYVQPMTIFQPPIANTQIEGKWRPDFGWSGRAWTIDIQSDRGLKIILEDRVYRIPPGSHRLYSNHNSTNTDEYGRHAFWGYPEYVSVEPMK